MTTPPDAHSDELRRAFTAQAGSFNSSPVANAPELLNAIVDLARPRPTERWLEAACGPGIIARRLAADAHSVLGVDVTPAMIDTARRKAAGLSNVSFTVADATATGLPGASVDGAVTRFSIHHIPVPGRLLAELARLVVPGGRIVVVDHLADDDGAARARAQEIERLRDPSHWACLTAAELRALGRGAGLDLVEERRLAYTLDFEDWLHRGTTDPAAVALVERALADGTDAGDHFDVAGASGSRTLTLQLWLGVWARPPARHP